MQSHLDRFHLELSFTVLITFVLPITNSNLLVWGIFVVLSELPTCLDPFILGYNKLLLRCNHFLQFPTSPHTDHRSQAFNSNFMLVYYHSTISAKQSIGPEETPDLQRFIRKCHHMFETCNHVFKLDKLSALQKLTFSSSHGHETCSLLFAVSLFDQRACQGRVAYYGQLLTLVPRAEGSTVGGKRRAHNLWT